MTTSIAAPARSDATAQEADTSDLKLLSQHACHGGVQGFYQHDSTSTGTPMRFGVFVPPQAAIHAVPVLFFLAGLSCTEETFAIKAGAQRKAAELGLMLVTPDASPRDTGITGAEDDWQFGTAASFYLNATRSPWSKHFLMETWITAELRSLVLQQFNACPQRVGLMGHSMGGHGALVLALRNPGLYRSVSALAPIVAPTQCPWGVNAFTGYLGERSEAWDRHDAAALIRSGGRLPDVLVDQGMSDKFLQPQLLIDELEAACIEVGQALTLRKHPGYDHGYYFISTFVDDHLNHHFSTLQKEL